MPRIWSQDTSIDESTNLLIYYDDKQIRQNTMKNEYNGEVSSERILKKILYCDCRESFNLVMTQKLEEQTTVK